MVYVLHKSGKPLMPTNKYGYVRFLLKSGKAKVVNLTPFVIQLTYDTGNITQPICIGLDIGRTNIGVAAIIENGTVLFAAEVRTRNKEITKLIQNRKAYRHKHRQLRRREKRKRRAKQNKTAFLNESVTKILPGTKHEQTFSVIRNKSVRFNNRLRPQGWLTPTAHQLLQTHLNLIQKISTFIPITDVAIEKNAFIIQNDYTSQINIIHYGDNCQLCGKAPVEHFHHIIPRHKNGSDQRSNLLGLCKNCHQQLHTNEAFKNKVSQQQSGQYAQFSALSLLNQVSTCLLKQLKELFPNHVYVCTGHNTSKLRSQLNLLKTHFIDAICIASSKYNKINKFNYDGTYYYIKQFRRHDRRVCRQENNKRCYYLDNKKVAENRHKAYEQAFLALSDYVNQGLPTYNLRVQKYFSTYTNIHRKLPGSIYFHQGKYKVLSGTQGRNKYGAIYIKFTDGSKSTPHNCQQILNNQGLVFIAKYVL